MYLPLAFVEITTSFSLEHRVAEPLYFLDEGHTIIDYNMNIITRVTSTIIGQQYDNITEYESVPIQRMITYHRPLFSTYMIVLSAFVIIKGFIIIKSFLFIVPFLLQLETSHELISLNGYHLHGLIIFFWRFFEFHILTYTDMGDIVDTSEIFLILLI